MYYAIYLKWRKSTLSFSHFSIAAVLALDFNKRKALDVKIHTHAGYTLYTIMDYMYVLPAGELRGDTLCYGLYYVSIVQ